MNRKRALAVMVSLFCFRLLISQVNDLAGIISSEKSWLTFPGQLGNTPPTVFEASLAPQWFFENGKQNGGLLVTGKIMVRMLRERSLPVYTPSYLPSVTWLKIADDDKGGNTIWSAGVGHHSNGQAGSFYDENGNINTHTGNFSTNYFKIGIEKIFSSQTTEKRKLRRLKRKYLRRVGAAIERHVNIDRSAELKGSYGFLRGTISAQSQEIDLSDVCKRITRKIRVRVTTSNTWIFDKLGETKKVNAKQRFISTVMLSWLPPKTNGFSFFVQSYCGQDYYNINYFRYLSAFRAGIMMEGNCFVSRKKT